MRELLAIQTYSSQSKPAVAKIDTNEEIKELELLDATKMVEMIEKFDSIITKMKQYRQDRINAAINVKL